MDAQQIGTHAVWVVTTIVVSLLLLKVTKNALVVACGAALAAAAVFSLYARIDAGFWDKFAAIAFFFVAAYAFALSLGMTLLGRLLKLRLFEKKPSSNT